jgi:glycosyltransferase involved in cell wall biosynthesis
MRVLFVSTYPELGPSARYRIVQYLEPLRALGVEGDFLPLFTNAFYETFFRPGRFVYKGAYLVSACMKRLVDALEARRYDVVFVQKEAANIGPPFFEMIAKHVFDRPVVFDLDDAIFHAATETHQPVRHPVLRRLLKDPDKAERIARLADEVIAAGSYTAEWARKFCASVTVIPTVVDGDVFKPKLGGQRARPVIGWVGSRTAAPQLEVAIPALEKLREKYDFTVKLVGAEREMPIRGVEVENLPWSLEREVEDFRSLDIGLCPLFDDVWSRGKPGFKPLIYMACGVPQVSTPLGGVTELMRPGEHGLFAMTTGEWYAALDRLLADRALREKMGADARVAFERGFSLKSETPRLYEVLARAAARGRAAA